MRLAVHIISSDIAPLNVGLFRADDSLILPPVENDGSLEAIVSALVENGIQALLIGSEFDLVFFSEHKEVIERETGALVVVSPPETVRMADDKWLTAEFLRRRGLPYAETAIPENLESALNTAKD